MKKIIVLSAILASVGMSAQAQQAGGNPVLGTTILATVLPTLTVDAGTKIVLGTSILSMDMSAIRKEVIAAAKEDAAIFGASEGASEKSAVLSAAFAEVQKIDGMAQLSEVEQAQIIVLMSEMN